MPISPRALTGENSITLQVIFYDYIQDTVIFTALAKICVKIIILCNTKVACVHKIFYPMIKFPRIPYKSSSRCTKYLEF